MISVSAPGQPREARRAGERRQRADMIGDLRDVGGNQRQRLIGRPLFEREDRLHGTRRRGSAASP